MSRKVNDVLDRTPLVLKPIKTPHSLQGGAMCHRNSLIAKTENKPLISIAGDDQPDNASAVPATGITNFSSKSQSLINSSQNVMSSIDIKPDLLNLIDNLIVDQTQPQHSSDTVSISDNNSADILSTPPNLNFDSFLDDLLTPEEFAPLDLVNGGLTNINYDFDISDISGENSVADDIPKTNSLGLSLEEFDPLLKDVDDKDSPAELEATNLIDGGDSPNDHTLLPSPLKPTVPPYKGFSAFDIPSISCQTGDFGSINYDASHKEDKDKDTLSNNAK